MKKALVFLTLIITLLLCLTACHSHKYGDWIVTKNANCTEDGTMTRYCDCGEKQSDTIPAIGHKKINLSAKDATCTETGLTEGSRCSDCYKTLVGQSQIPMIAHSYDNDNDTKCNTCGFERILNCKHDNPEKIEKIPATHPTCITTGLTEGLRCAPCGTMVVPQAIAPVIDCIVGDWIVDWEPTYTEEGKRHKECTMCGNLLVEEKIPVLIKDCTLGMGVVVNFDNAKIISTIASVVLDEEGRIVVCRIDAIQNKFILYEYGTFEITNFKTQRELGYDAGLSKYGQSIIGNATVKEWFEQADAFEAWCIGKTIDEVKNKPTQNMSNGHIISAEDDLLNAGCTIDVTNFVDAVVKAGNDDQKMAFKTSGDIKLGLGVESYDIGSAAASYNSEGCIYIKSEFAASAVVDGKIVASLNDVITATVYFNETGIITRTQYRGTNRELKEDFRMSAFGNSTIGNTIVKERYLQSAAFSTHVVGMTAADVAAMPTQLASNGYIISADDELLTAGCTISIDYKKAVVVESVENAR